MLQAAGYTGLLLFALRAPVDRCEGRWRGIERALPALAILFLAVALMSLGAVFGYPTEFAMRASILIGFAVSAAALGILIGRRRDLSPRDYQRIRWVIWGCLIGLPAYLIAEISQETSLPASLFGEAAVDGGRVGSLLSRQRDPVRLCRGGGAPPDRGQRLDPTAPRDGARPLAQRAGVFRP